MFLKTFHLLQTNHVWNSSILLTAYCSTSVLQELWLLLKILIPTSQHAMLLVRFFFFVTHLMLLVKCLCFIIIWLLLLNSIIFATSLLLISWLGSLHLNLIISLPYTLLSCMRDNYQLMSSSRSWLIFPPSDLLELWGWRVLPSSIFWQIMFCHRW